MNFLWKKLKLGLKLKKQYENIVLVNYFYRYIGNILKNISLLKQSLYKIGFMYCIKLSTYTYS